MGLGFAFEGTDLFNRGGTTKQELVEWQEQGLNVATLAD